MTSTASSAPGPALFPILAVGLYCRLGGIVAAGASHGCEYIDETDIHTSLRRTSTSRGRARSIRRRTPFDTIVERPFHPTPPDFLQKYGSSGVHGIAPTT